MLERIKRLGPGARIAFKTVEFLSFLAVIPTVLFFFWQQDRERQADAISQSMNLISMANQGELLLAKNRTISPWLEAPTAEFFASNPSDEEIAAFEQEIGANDVPKLDLILLGDFYKSVLTCRESGVCDKATIDDHFSSEITGFYCNYQARLNELAANFGQPDAYQTISDYSGC